MDATLFSAERHEPLSDLEWDERIALSAIDRIATDTVAAFSPDGLWPIHPTDRSPERASVLTPLYYGAAGVVWALHSLGYLTAEIKASLPTISAMNRSSHPSRDAGADSFLMGQPGIELLQRVIDEDMSAGVLECLRQGVDLDVNGIVWGRAGTAIGALHLLSATGREDARRVFLETVDSLISEWHEFDGAWSWQTSLYGHVDRMISALHGMAGNLAPVIQGIDYLPTSVAQLARGRIMETLERTALKADGCCNWPLVHGISSRPTADSRLLQHCNGAPGLVNIFGAWNDPAIDALLIAAGELVWRAGPLRKRPSLCHGVPGSGFALLRLFERTGDQQWLDRARRFAMHAIAQDQAALADTGQRKFSLWTGDLGLAMFLRHCVEARAGFPTIDYF